MIAFISASTRAQEAPTPGEADLEVPAEPSKVPQTWAVPSAPPSEATPPKADTTPPPPVADTNKVADLERRVDELEKRAAAAESARAKREAEEKAEPAWLSRDAEPTPFTRRVRRGFFLSGYVQGDYLHSQLSEDQLQQGGIPINQDRFYLRRARLRVDRGWEYAALAFELDANTVGSPTVGIRRAEASLYYQAPNDAVLPPLVMVTGGVTDLPFGYEQYESERSSMFMERSLVSSALFPTRQDAGIKVSGAIAFVRYGFSLTNGEPVDALGFPRDPNSAKDLTGRVGVDVPIGRTFRITGGSSFATGEGFHAGPGATKPSLVFNDDNQNGIVNLINANEVGATQGNAAVPSQNFGRWAFGLDLGFSFRTSLGETHVYGELIAASNYDRGLRPSDPVGGVDVRQLGGYAAVTQEITPYAFAGFRASTYDPNADVLEHRQNRQLPKTQTIRTLSPVVGVRLPKRARLFFQYDFTRDYLARDATGVPTDAKNDAWTARLQVDL
jgi:hypothetical protein